MALTEENRLNSPISLHRNVSVVMLADVVRSQGIVQDFAAIRKAAPPDPHESAKAVALAIIEAYEPDHTAFDPGAVSARLGRQRFYAGHVSVPASR